MGKSGPQCLVRADNEEETATPREDVGLQSKSGLK